MGTLVLSGDTSGSITLDAPAVAGSSVQTLVAATGTLAPLISGTAVASTSGTSIDFTGIPSWVRRITVMFQGVSTSGTSPPQIQIGSGSFVTTGYLCSNSIVLSSGVQAVNFTSGFGIGVNTINWSATTVSHGQIIFSLVNATNNSWCESGLFGATGFAGIYSTAGSLALSGVLDRLRITTVNGTDTFDAGSINIMYE
jgi:hypothetical protein